MSLLGFLFGAPKRRRRRKVTTGRKRRRKSEYQRTWERTPAHRRNPANVRSRVAAAKRGRAMIRALGIDPRTGRDLKRR